MSNKGNIKVQLQPGEALVVLERGNWDHMISLYKRWGSECSDPKERAQWLSVAEHVQYWVDKTSYTQEDRDEW